MITEAQLQRQLAETSAEKKRVMAAYAEAVAAGQMVDYSAAELTALDQQLAAIKQAIEDTHRKAAENAEWHKSKEFQQLQKRETELAATLHNMRVEIEGATKDLSTRVEKLYEVDQELTKTRQQLGNKKAVRSILSGRFGMVRILEEGLRKAISQGRLYETVNSRYAGGRDTWYAGPANPRAHGRKKSRHSQ